jgi:hypothetical protein
VYVHKDIWREELTERQSRKKANSISRRERYYQTHRKHEDARRAAYRKANAQKLRDYAKKYRQDHFEQISAREKRRRAENRLPDRCADA